MELISFLGKLFGYTPEIANVISGELRSVSEARRRPKVLHFLCNLFIYAAGKRFIYHLSSIIYHLSSIIYAAGKVHLFIYAEGFYPLAPNCSKMPQQAE